MNQIRTIASVASKTGVNAATAKIVTALLVSATLAGCGAPRALVRAAQPTAPTAQQAQAQAQVQQAQAQAQQSAQVIVNNSTTASQVTQSNAALNRQLAQLAVSQSGSPSNTVTDYQVGAGDILELAVFQVEELNRKVRVSGKGSIIIPLLGEVMVGGKSASEIELDLATQLGAKYLQNPQVSVFVAEHRSQRITVMGAVNKATVHNVTRPRSVLEMLSESGGLADNASKRIHVKTSIVNTQGVREARSFVIDLKKMMEENAPGAEIMLRGGDSIYVPEAGVVFVEGYVLKPGSYSTAGGVNVLKAVALAGGAQNIADQNNVQLIRQSGAGQTQVVAVNLEAIRLNQIPDVVVQDGDIIVVPPNNAKKNWSTFWKGFSSIFGIGTSI